VKRRSDPLRFDYESTGEQTFFRDADDPHPRSWRVFAFHLPETLLCWLQKDQTLRQRVQLMPPWDRARSLIQMATGAGKTVTACTFSRRLLKHARAHRILFLVDRNNLGAQTLKECQNYDPPGSGRKFVQTYTVQRLSRMSLPPPLES
jgi:type I restriction enzyme, R subunit